MGNLYAALEWTGLLFGTAIVGLVCGFLLVRRRILRHVKSELGREAMLLATGARVGAVNGNGNGEAHQPASALGVLMLLSTGLYFHSWVGNREVFVPGPSISWIGMSEAPRGSRSERHRIMVRFLNTAGKEDGISIRLLYPEQWVEAIKTHLITRAL
jgi:heme exporter protein D